MEPVNGVLSDAALGDVFVSSVPSDAPWAFRRPSGYIGGRPAGAFAGLGLILALLAVVALALAGCGRSKRSKPQLSKRVVPLGQPVPKGGGIYKVGKPYQVAGKWYKPKEDPSYDRVGVASWYGELFHGRRTANGEIYDMNALTAAHPTLPMPVYARVTNLTNGRSLVVRINDRGPYARGRIIDLSKRTATLLGFKRQGTARVRVTYMGRAPLNGDDRYERRVLASRRWSRQVAAAPKPRPPRVSDPITVASLPKPQPARLAPAEASDLAFIQAGAFRNQDNADRLRAKLAGLGTVDVFPAEIQGTMLYRVRLGPFRAPGEAERALQHVVDAGVPDARITRH